MTKGHTHTHTHTHTLTRKRGGEDRSNTVKGTIARRGTLNGSLGKSSKNPKVEKALNRERADLLAWALVCARTQFCSQIISLEGGVTFYDQCDSRGFVALSLWLFNKQKGGTATYFRQARKNEIGCLAFGEFVLSVNGLEELVCGSAVLDSSNK